jgi:hypothetical protein
MWRTPWPWSILVLAGALILVARRLSDVQVKLERVRAKGQAGQTKLSGGVDSVDGQSAWAAVQASDMAAEWEQAVPPMDS